MLSTRLLSSQEKIADQPGQDTDHDPWPPTSGQCLAYVTKWWAAA